MLEQRYKLHRPVAILFALAGLCAVAAADAQAQMQGDNVVIDQSYFQNLSYRMIGPFRAGRVTAVAGVRTQPRTFYFGSTGGGVWKTENGGIRWNNVSDGYFEAGSVGAVAVADSDPNVIYVGTGSAAIRGNVSPGIGMYKSTDAGETWRHIGLREAGQIGKVRVHPRDPNLVYVAALGHAFGPNDERGVFRSRDGGDTWEKVLYISENTGAIDISMSWTNPEVIYAAMWTARRSPWSLVSGGEESGIYKTSDGGDTWSRLTGGGLPEGVMGKIGVSISGANPNRVWALIEAADGGVYRTDDGGTTWQYLNSEAGLRARPWYYTYIHADPQDENVVYISSEDFWRSTDGGETFELVRVPHGDTHGLWINPDHPEIMIEANDGGANISFDWARTWSSIMNQPTAEFYRVTVDNQFPYRVYGGQQDNSTLSVPSRTNTGGIMLQHYYSVGGGESGHIAVDPRNPSISYAGSYGGTLTYRDMDRMITRNIIVYPQLAGGQAARDLRYRFQWNFPVRLSPHNPDIVYATSQHVHRSTNRGQTWEVISPDLSYNDPATLGYSGGPISRDNTGVEVFGTVFAFEESPHVQGLLWAGTDDGRVQISRNGGQSWDGITPSEVTPNSTVNMIELSAHDAGRAFIAVQRYRLDDFRPYIYRTNDYGNTWELLTDGSNGIPDNHFTRVVREDPERRGLLYAGTEFGMYISFDDGAHWQSFQLNLPVTPITDLAVHRQDLVVATQGRSFWILDDLTPLHQVDEAAAAQTAFLYTPRDTYRMRGGGGGSGNSSTFRDGYGGAAVDLASVAEDGPIGAQLAYYLSAVPSGDITLEILAADGDVIQTFSSSGDDEARQLPQERGLNRFTWDLRYPDAEIIGELFRGTERGPLAVPGDYQARLTVNGQSQTKMFRVLKDPRVEATIADLQAQFDLLITVRDALSEAYGAIGRIRQELEGLSGDERASELARTLTELEGELIETRIRYREDVWNFPSKLNHQLAYLAQVVASADSRPTDASYERFEELRMQLTDVIERLEEALKAVS